MSLLLLGILGSCVNDPELRGTKLAQGDSLPPFTVTTSTGKVMTNSLLSHGRWVIVFFSTTCPDCRRLLPLIEQEYRKSYRNAEYICIARAQEEETIAGFWKENDLTLPYSPQHDRRIYSLFADSGIPLIYVTENGLITAVYTSRDAVIDQTSE